MQPNFDTRQRRRTFIEVARRRQIVESAIEVISTVGYARASLALTAKHAGVSRSLISYHFAGKDDLIKQVLETVFAEAAQFMGPSVEAATTPASKLKAYIESNLNYLGTHRHSITAVVEIVSAGMLGELGVDALQAEDEALAPLVEVLEQGQSQGEFREFDALLMARSIRAVIDSVAARLADPRLDPGACAREITTLFELATRAPTHRGTPR